tara:strand:+ start:11270 stop:12004 length:735 start_codon:yes stop_codon:yes gene_type:complete
MAINNLVLTIEDARAFAKLLLDETGDLFWTETEQTRLANEANRAVYRELISSNPEYFIKYTGPVSWPSDTESVDLTSGSYLGQTPYKIITIEDTDDSGAVARDNMAYKWKPMRFVDRFMVNRTAERIVRDVGRFYVVVGKNLYIAPIPNESLNVHFYWVPRLPATSNATDTLLRTEQSVENGAAEEFGDLVGVYLAKLMNAKQNGNNPVIDSLWAEGLARMQSNAQSRQIDEPIGVRITRGPWE